MSGFDRKAKNEDLEKRIVVIDPDKCKPNSAAFAYLKRYSGGCGKDCISHTKKLVVISEMACAQCLNRAKACPGGAVSVVRLPNSLTSDTTHRYGPNSFKVHGLPTPRPGSVLGLLGTNGIGKSTVLSILSGRVKPNLGRFEPPLATWSDVVKYYRGSDLQNYFTMVLENKLRVAIKPQLDPSFARRLKGQVVRDLIAARDERKVMHRVVQELDLEHVLDREVQQLSGGELQRFAIAATIVKEADVYMFDEPTSFLDVKQRLAATDAIRDICEESCWPGGAEESSKKYVIVVEHDLAILDYMSDYIQCVYGNPGIYGVVTSRTQVRNGINQYLAGYFPAENMRFRSYELTFKVSTTDFFVSNELGVEGEETEGASEDKKVAQIGELRYPAMTKSYGNFTLRVEPGSFRAGEVIALMGENGCGKTTFLELLAGRTAEQRGKEKAIGSHGAGGDGTPPSLKSLGVAYKQQILDPKIRKFEGTVQELLEQEINSALCDRLFRLLVIKALNVDQLVDLRVRSLSGGEMQRLSIVLCLGMPAFVYLIDEPSAGLDCEQRVIAAKVMKRWIVNHLGRTCFVIEHDFVMATSMADKVIVYEGTPGVSCVAKSPCSVIDGFNLFLKHLDVTFRRDPINCRPRINKKNSQKDKEQKARGEYFLFNEDMDD